MVVFQRDIFYIIWVTVKNGGRALRGGGGGREEAIPLSLRGVDLPGLSLSYSSLIIKLSMTVSHLGPLSYSLLTVSDGGEMREKKQNSLYSISIYSSTQH